MYSKGKATLWKAAETADVSLYEIMELIKKRKIPAQFDKSALEEEIERIDLTRMSDEEFQSIVRQRLAGIMQNNGNSQKVINLNQVERFISEGWEFVSALPNDRAIVKTPF